MEEYFFVLFLNFTSHNIKVSIYKYSNCVLYIRGRMVVGFTTT